MSLYKKSLEVDESESALRGFTIKYTIEGQAGYDTSSFFEKVKESVIHLFISNPSTKVVLIFHCVMERLNKETDQLEFTLPYFHTASEINLRGTDLNEF